MEISELVSYYVFNESREIEISFRLNYDNDDEIRNDLISLADAESYGYNLIEEDSMFFEDDDDEYEDFDDFNTVNEDLLLEYLNEYYVVNPDKLPKVEFF